MLLEAKQGGVTTAEALTLALVEKALAGDVRAFEVIRDTIGENPRQVVEAEISGGFSIRWQE